MDKKWRIWSIEHGAWWGPAWRGYVLNKTKAGLYSYEEALKIVRGANKHRREDQVPNEAMILADDVSDDG